MALWYWLIRWASSAKRRSRGGGNDDRGGGDWNRRSCGGLRGSGCVPAVTKTARKVVGAAMACLYTGTLAASLLQRQQEPEDFSIIFIALPLSQSHHFDHLQHRESLGDF